MAVARIRGLRYYIGALWKNVSKDKSREWGMGAIILLVYLPSFPTPYSPLLDCHFDLHAADAFGICGGKLKLVDSYCAETRARDRLASVGKGDLSRPADLFPGDGQLAASREPIVLYTAAEREFLIRACGK